MFPHSLPIIKRLAAIISFLKVSLVNEVLQRVHPLIPHPLHGHLRIQRPSPSNPLRDSGLSVACRHQRASSSGRRQV